MALTLSAAAIHASPSVSPDGNAGSATLVTSGQKCLDLFVNSGRDGSFAKMFLAMWTTDSTPYCHSWSVKTTPAGRFLFRLAPSARPIGEKGFGLLPTPLASDGRRAFLNAQLAAGRKVRTSLNLRVKNLPDYLAGFPNPIFVEWMMGFPMHWSDYRRLETQSFHRSQKSSAAQSLPTKAT